LAHMAHPAGGCGDPLSESLCDQAAFATTPGELPAPLAPRRREGWETERTDPPVTWPVMLVWVLALLCGIFTCGCGGGDMPEAEDDTRVTTPATPAPERRQ
jgi:hypothetical protein